MAANPNNCMGCLLPPCLIHGNHQHTNSFSSKSDNYRLKLRNPKRKENLWNEKPTTSAEARTQRSSLNYSQQRREVLQVFQNSHQSSVETGRVNTHYVDTSNDNQGPTNAVEEDQPSSLNVLQDLNKMFQAPLTEEPQCSAENENKSSPSTVCVVRPFSKKQNIDNADSDQTSSEDVPSTSHQAIQRRSISSSQGVGWNSPSFSHEIQINPSISSLERRREIFQVAKNSSPPPILEQNGRMISQNLYNVHPSIQHIRESFREALMQQKGEAIQVSRNVQAPAPSSYIVPEDTLRVLSSERTQNLFQVQSRQFNSASNVSNREQANVIEEIKKLEFLRHHQLLRSTQESLNPSCPLSDISSESPPQVREDEQSESEEEEEQEQEEEEDREEEEEGGVIKEEQEVEIKEEIQESYLFIQSQQIKFPYQNPANQNEITPPPGNYIDFQTQALDHTGLCAFHAAIADREIQQSNVYAQDFSGITRETVYVQNTITSPNTLNVPIGVVDCPEQVIPRQLILESSLPPNRRNTYGNSTADMRGVLSPHHSTSTIVSGTANQYLPPPTGSGIDYQRIQEQFIQVHNHSHISNHQSVVERYGRNQLSSTASSSSYHNYSQQPSSTESVPDRYGPMLSGGPYPNYFQISTNLDSNADIYGPMVSAGPYPNYSQRTTYPEPIPDRYGAMVSGGPYPNYSQRSTYPESIPDRYVAMVSGDPYPNYSQRSSNNESVLGRYIPTISGDTNQNYSQRSSYTGSVPDRYNPYQMPSTVLVANQNINQFPERYSPNLNYHVSQHHTPPQQTSTYQMYNHSQTYENHSILGSYWQSPTQLTSEPRMTQESMQNLHPAITNSPDQYQIPENLSVPDRYEQQPPPTAQMNPSDQQQNHLTNQHLVAYRNYQHLNPHKNNCRLS